MSTQQTEQRMLCSDLKVDRSEGDKPKIRGYASVFNTLSEDLGGFREQIMAGAFADAIGRDDVRALINHDPNLVLGRNRSGTLVMREDANGLAIEIDPPDTQAARDLLALMERGDVSQMSFSFTVSKEDQTWERSGTGPWIRTVKRVNRLYDVAVVTYPAYTQSTASVRDALSALEEHQRDGSPPQPDPLRGALLDLIERPMH